MPSSSPLLEIPRQLVEHKQSFASALFSLALDKTHRGDGWGLSLPRGFEALLLEPGHRALAVWEHAALAQESAALHLLRSGGAAFREPGRVEELLARYALDEGQVLESGSAPCPQRRQSASAAAVPERVHWVRLEEAGMQRDIVAFSYGDPKYSRSYILAMSFATVSEGHKSKEMLVQVSGNLNLGASADPWNGLGPTPPRMAY